MRIAVTGAFGYSGRYITQRLLQGGHNILTLTNSWKRPNPFGAQVSAVPFNFDAPAKLEESLRGCEALVNTYWVRFDHRLFTHNGAVKNTQMLFDAAKRAGVRRIVHISITNPDINSDLPYFRGKAMLENSLRGLGVSYAILRPTVLFGKEDVLINNIAWSLRHLPFFGVFGSGDYKLQPIYVEDLASAAANLALDSEDKTIEAIGPETFTYRGLVSMVRDSIRVSRPILSVPPWLGYYGTLPVGWLFKDKVITKEEIRGLMGNRLYVDAPPLGTTRLSEWTLSHRDTLGRRYTSEMARRVDRVAPYASN